MNTKRLFIGTFIDKSLFAEHLATVQKSFEGISKGKWTESDNLHFTYIFLGEVPVNEIPEMQDALKTQLISYDSKLIIRGLGVFPGLSNPRVMFSKIENPDKLVDKKQKEIERILFHFGFKPEQKQFKAHVTLQRIKFAQNLEFRKCISDYEDFEFGTMDKFSIDLIESRLTTSGPVYLSLNAK
jgi:2'-5' RNA ligase